MIEKFLARLHVGKPVQPPAAPPPLHIEQAPFSLPVPFALEEFPRTFLHLLKTSDQVPAPVKQMITLWLEDFDKRLMDYMHQYYGESVDHIAIQISASVMTQQANYTKTMADNTERDVIEEMEKRLNEEGKGA